MTDTHTAQIADDLFAGAGGWDIGAAALDIHARGVELMPEARATRAAAGLETIHDDVWTFRPDGQAVGSIASPPCPTFSSAGRGSGRRAMTSILEAIAAGAYRDLDQLRQHPVDDDDDRTRLVLTPLHFATTYDYEWIAWEQVPSVLPVWQACAAVLREQGWHVWTGKLHAERYGAPQTRTRAALIASRRHRVAEPVATHSRYYSHDPSLLELGVHKWRTMADALNGHGWHDHDLVGFPRRADSNDVVTIDGIDYRGRDLRNASHPAQTVTEKTRSWKRWVLRGSNNAHAAIRRTDQPAPTMLFGNASNDVRWYPEGHTTPGVAETAAARCADSKRVTVAEAGILQTFPANYPWQGKASKQYLQAGNAVPPALAAAAIAAAL